MENLPSPSESNPWLAKAGDSCDSLGPGDVCVMLMRRMESVSEKPQPGDAQNVGKGMIMDRNGMIMDNSYGNSFGLDHLDWKMLYCPFYIDNYDNSRTGNPTRWCPSSLAKLVQITPISLWFMADITMVNGVYKPTYNWGAPHCSFGLDHFISPFPFGLGPVSRWL